jgi:hypothetical protein
MSLIIGNRSNEQLKISILGYEREPVGEYYDDNWLNCYIELSFGAFNGAFEASFLTNDFVLLLPQLEALYKDLDGEAKFSSLEQQLEFTLMGNGKGLIELNGKAIDHRGSANHLKFNCELDQTFLPSIIQKLKILISDYPQRAL